MPVSGIVYVVLHAFNFMLRDCLGHPGLPTFRGNSVSVSTSVNQAAGVLIGIVLSLWIKLRNIDVFALVNLNHEHEVYTIKLFLYFACFFH